MAYSTIDKSTDYFRNKIYTGNGTDDRDITWDESTNLQPDMLWSKGRSNSDHHSIYDSVRGSGKELRVAETGAQYDRTNNIQALQTNGFQVGDDGQVNGNSVTYVSWGWLAGGASPSQTYTVKVVSDSGNKYRFDDFGTSAVTLDLQEGGTYTFDQSDSSNSGHPLRFSTTSNGSHGGGSEYTTGVTTNGTPGSSGAYTRITVASGAPTLYYYCTAHSGMGGQANTNSTFGSSNFSGSIQSTVSVNTTAGFSIVSYTGTGSAATIGHGLGVKPSMIIAKNLSSSYGWYVYHKSIAATHEILLNSNAAKDTTSQWNDTEPTSSVFSVGTAAATNGSGNNFVAYCFAEKTGYSKFGSYTGNGNADGTFVYTGFKPAFVIVKQTNETRDWLIMDNKRLGYNPNNYDLHSNGNDTEDTNARLDLLSNGFKQRITSSANNKSGATYIYMAFGQLIVGSNNVPATAR